MSPRYEHLWQFLFIVALFTVAYSFAAAGVPA